MTNEIPRGKVGFFWIVPGRLGRQIAWGGAAALTAVIWARGCFTRWFPVSLVPVAINSVILVLLGVVFHRIAGRQYPHRQVITTFNPYKTANLPSAIRVGLTRQTSMRPSKT